MENVSNEYNSQTLCNGRNIACTILCYAFDKNGHLNVLVIKQNDNAPYLPGKWTTPGGYLSSNETCQQCAAEKIWSACKINIRPNEIELMSIDSDVSVGNRPLTVYYVYFMPHKIDDIAIKRDICNIDTILWRKCDIHSLMHYDWAGNEMRYILDGKKFIKKHHYFNYLMSLINYKIFI